MSKVIQVARAGGIQLEKQGSKYRGLCCFHSEHHASMWLDPTLDSFHCFGCGASGGYVKLAGRLGVDLSAAIGPPSPRHPLVRHVVAEPSRAPVPVAVDASDLPTRTTDVGVLRYLERRAWMDALRLGLLRFPTAETPVVKWGDRQVPAFEKGYRLGALLLDLDGRPSGLQLRRVTDEDPRFYTLGHGAFGTRSRVATARGRIYLAEGLGDYLAAVRSFDMPFSPVIGVPGTSTARKLLEPCAFPRGVEVVILFDRDGAGDRAAREVAALVRRSGGVPMRAWPASEREAEHG